MPNLNLPHPLAAALVAAITLGSLGATTADGQTSSGHPHVDADRQESVQAARASWTPTRSTGQSRKKTTSTAQRKAVQPKASRNAHASRPTSKKRVIDAPILRPSGSAATQGPVQLAAHQVPSPPPMQGEVIYESPVVDGSCDALGGSCGCDAMGCDAMGSCGPSCGCSMCGELPSGRAWRPAITLSLPQDGWFRVEGMTLWTDGMPIPPLVTTSPQGTSITDAGVLTRSGTQTLYGGQNILKGSSAGVKLDFGFWLDRCHTLALGADYLEMDTRQETFSATSTGNPILARPFFNSLTGREDSELVAFNNNADVQLTGTVSVDSYSEFAGGGFYVRRLMCCDEGCNQGLFCGCNEHYCSRKEFRVGYRYMELNEGVTIREDLINSGTINRGQFNVADGFATTNQFNGIDFGWSQRMTRNYWTFEALFRLGIGNTRQSVTVAGSTTIVDQNDPSNPTTETFDEGILALSTNSGTYRQDQFSVLPELNLTLGYQLSDHFRATLGYTGVYWSNVVRPGHHIPTMANPDFFAPVIASSGDPRPLFSFDTTDYWAHGINYGIEYRW